MSAPEPEGTTEPSEQNAEKTASTLPRTVAAVPVVGIGGSAGSIGSLVTFFKSVPEAPGVAFVVVLHLAADHESTLAELLQRCTSLPVIQVQETLTIEPDHIYVIPPGKSLQTAGDQLQLGLLKRRGRPLAVDLFLRSLAESHGPKASAVVLSGADGDGAIGIKRIKERGGLTVAQSPEEAEYDGMPRASIETGMVDWVLPVSQMSERLLRYHRLGEQLRLPTEEEPASQASRPPPGHDEAALRDILTFLRARTGRDFSSYKRATVLRRIARRMQVNSIEDLPSYLNCLRTNSAEAGALLQDLLISVTNFFRDPESFAALQRQIPALFAKRGPNETVRVWVVACATGEEAYSVGMMLAEYARELDAPPLIQIFATDLDEEAIQAAREGLYPAAIEADVSDDRLQRFFIKEHRGYRVRRELREMVLFATHDVLKDSPFSRLDLVSCRNLLIYLNRDAQARVFETFHFALNPGAVLFLGSSESVDDGSPLFAVADKKYRIYKQRAAPRIGLPVPSGPGTLALQMQRGTLSPGVQVATEAASTAAAAQPSLPLQRAGRMPEHSHRTSWGELHLRLLEELAPPSILVDSEYEIVHLSPSAGRFLQFTGGEPSRNLLRSVNSALRIELRAALLEAGQTRKTSEVPDLPIELDGEALVLRLSVTPVGEPGADLYIVLLDSRPAAVQTPEPADAAARLKEPDPVARHLDRELERLKSHLRDTVEQYEASTEELKASNEELQAMNEELRSATEELETGREELQSINEELTTVNHELKAKVDELGHANSDMQNLMDATAIATIFLDRDLRIKRYTPSAISLFNLIPTDLGRPLADLTTQLNYRELSADAHRVLERLVPVEREVGQADGSWFLARLLPYRTTDDRIAGIVLSFIDITERKQAEEVRLWLSAVVAFSSDAIMSFALDGTILSWNGGAESMFGYAEEEIIGRPLSILSPEQDVRETALLEKVIAGQQVQNFETVRRRKDGSTLQVSMTISPIHDDNGRVMAGTATARDITVAKQVEAELRESREQLRLVIENADEFAIFSTDLDRRVTTWNAGAQRILGYSEKEVVGRSVDVIFTEEDRAAGAPEQEADLARTEGRAADDRFHVRKDGTRFWASGAMMLMRDSAAAAVGFVKVLRDQTLMRKAQDAAERSKAELLEALQDNLSARRALEVADAAKDRFLAVLSHELRTPLASISSAAQVLEGPDTDGDRNRAADVVRRQGAAMRELLNDLLDVSRLRLGRLALQRQAVRISAVVESALEATRPQIDAANHTLIVRLPVVELEVDADPVRLAQVISNLVSNAAKYTPAGGHISVSAELVENEVVVTVADDGIGMVPAEIDAMFDMFVQAPEARERIAGGLGIGLALSRSIVQLHGGWIHATSAGPGQGSRFRFGLPVFRATALDAPPTPRQLVPLDVPPSRETKILVADDNRDAAWGLAKLLERAGYGVVIANGGLQAVELTRTHRPDVALLDIGMPDLDGHEVARQLRADVGNAEMMLIAATGWGQPRDIQDALNAGFDAHLTKPVDVETIRKLIDEHLLRRMVSEAPPK